MKVEALLCLLLNWPTSNPDGLNRMPISSVTPARSGTNGWIISSLALKRHSTLPPSGSGLTTMTDRTCASAASHPPRNWKWLRKFYDKIPLKERKLPSVHQRKASCTEEDYAQRKKSFSCRVICRDNSIEKSARRSPSRSAKIRVAPSPCW